MKDEDVAQGHNSSNLQKGLLKSLSNLHMHVKQFSKSREEALGD